MLCTISHSATITTFLDDGSYIITGVISTPSDIFSLTETNLDTLQNVTLEALFPSITINPLDCISNILVAPTSLLNENKDRRFIQNSINVTQVFPPLLCLRVIQSEVAVFPPQRVRSLHASYRLAFFVVYFRYAAAKNDAGHYATYVLRDELW